MSKNKIGNANPPSILMFVPKYPYPIIGGLERQSHELSKALMRLNINISVLSIKNNSAGIDCECVEGVNVIRLPWHNNQLFQSFLSAARLAAYMFRLRNNCNVVHIHNISWAGGIVLSIAKLLGKKTLVKLPNVGAHGIPGIQDKFLGFFLLYIFKKSDVLIALSDDSAEEILSIGYPKRKILKITNGVALENYYSHNYKAPNPGTINVLFLGRLAKQKGIFDLLSAWAMALERIPNLIVLNICGEGPLEKEILNTIKEMGLTDSIKLHGNVSNTAEMLQNSDIFILPSYFEGNSNAILEAMSSGLPIISTCVGGTLTLVGSEGEKLICRPGDREALANNLIALATNADLRSSYGEQMRRRAVNYFDIAAIAKNYLEAYKLLASPKSDLSINDLSSPIFDEKNK